MESQLINADTLRESVHLANSIIPIFISGFIALGTVITVMWISHQKQQKIIISLQKETAEALTKSHLIIESNTKSHDKLQEILIKKWK